MANIKYGITKVDKYNWRVDRTAPGEDKKTKEVVEITKSMGYYTRLDQAAKAVYELATKDNVDGEVCFEYSRIYELTSTSLDVVADVVEKALKTNQPTGEGPF